jgi:hypothetical protein
MHPPKKPAGFSYTIAKAITTNSAEQSHNFHAAGDRDWLKFTTGAGITYTLVTTDTGGHYGLSIAKTGMFEVSDDHFEVGNSTAKRDTTTNWEYNEGLEGKKIRLFPNSLL